MGEQHPIISEEDSLEFDGDLSQYTLDGLYSLRRNLGMLNIVLFLAAWQTVLIFIGLTSIHIGNSSIRQHSEMIETFTFELTYESLIKVPILFTLLILQPIVVIISYRRLPWGRSLFIILGLLNLGVSPLLGIFGVWSGFKAGKVFFSSNSVSVKEVSIEIQKRKISKRYA